MGLSVMPWACKQAPQTHILLKPEHMPSHSKVPGGAGQGTVHGPAESPSSLRHSGGPDSINQQSLWDVGASLENRLLGVVTTVTVLNQWFHRAERTATAAQPGCPAERTLRSFGSAVPPAPSPRWPCPRSPTSDTS